MNQQEKQHKALRILLSDFGYRFDGGTLIRKGIRGFTSDSIVGKRNGLLNAVESLIPIIHDDEFYRRWRKLGYTTGVLTT